ncbi:MAG: Fe(2+)-trafficking protein [Phycisphaeraceae bacterium]|nr:Fe(2+)-trafficking protein [Phycisphaerae bacterium]MBX3392817.1 Fe(2+)-trafficking protein [Phycisphaeraceae bacterium]HRJ50996.1 Fe(2+)-trafficking protein [Phycisphaerales bacterium]
MDPTQRIAQFEAMVRPGADPDNDMAWFSLANAYRDANRHADAARAYERCFQLNPAMSKAYQLAGQSLIEAGDRERAGHILTQGYAVAAGRGDRMPMKAMGDLLVTLGVSIPPVAGEAPARSASPGGAEGSFTCSRTGRPGTKMDRPPFRGPVGLWIAEHISRETWEAWIAQGTKIINELRLDLSNDESAETYDRHMREYLGIDDDLHAELTRVRS